VARVSLKILQTRKSRREEPQGVHVPDDIAGLAETPHPEDEALLADSVGPALLVILDTLDPVERLAFVLHDMFAVPFDEIATIVGRSPAAARQLASRARRRVQGSTLRPEIAFVNERSWTRFLPHRAMVSSTRCCRCSIPTSCCARMTRPYRWVQQQSFWVRRSLPRHCPGERGRHSPFSSTGNPERCGWWMAGLASCSSSPSRVEGSSAST
jgi:hypothetical protein